MFDYIMDMRCYGVNDKCLVVHTLVFVFTVKAYLRSEVRRGTVFAENINWKSFFIYSNMTFWKNNLGSKFFRECLGS